MDRCEMQGQRSERRGRNMTYSLNITEHANELLDNLVYHLIYRLKNKQAAGHLLKGINDIYDRFEDNPFQFPKCRDAYLTKKNYREAIVSGMSYIVVFNIDGNVVNVLGIFHQLGNYQSKM